MRFAFFTGCKIPYYQPHYADATQEVMKALDVELVELEFNCCGYPVRNQDADAYLLSAIRNLALAEANGLDIFTPCQCCYGSLKKAAYRLSEDPDKKEQINQALAEEGLTYQGKAGVNHLLTVLGQKVGPGRIAEAVVNPFEDLKIAVHYGCHALRPSWITEFDDPWSPTIFEELVNATGATSLDWPHRLQCCGNPLWGKNDELALDITSRKLTSASQVGADYLCVACTYCQIQFDTIQSQEMAGLEGVPTVPSILYPQLLGVAMGLDPAKLGIDKNVMPAEGILKRVAPSAEE